MPYTGRQSRRVALAIDIDGNNGLNRVFGYYDVNHARVMMTRLHHFACAIAKRYLRDADYDEHNDSYTTALRATLHRKQERENRYVGA